MSTFLRIVLIVSFSQFLVLKAVCAQQTDENDSKSDQVPGTVTYHWVIRNYCNEVIKLAVQIETGGKLVTAGWWRLEPTKILELDSNTHLVAWYAQSHSWRWIDKKNGHSRNECG